MYHSAVYDEPLLNELACEQHHPGKPTTILPASIRRTTPLTLPTLDETQIIRHFTHLSHMNYGVDTGIYPLGSCTMKYNPKLCERISVWEGFSCMHPYQDDSTKQGSLQLMYDLEQWLCEITGMHSFTMQPAAGAQGEFTGLLLTKAYHEAQGESQRNQVILPDTSHGTNPASAVMAGYDIIELPSTSEGTVDLHVLETSLSEHTACFMLTNPNTLGIFESDIKKIASLVHNAGGLLYYDGANMNAIMGKTRPGDMGFDIVHLNVHKTFSTPHGGGGPGAGPIGVQKKLEPFLPVPRIQKQKNQYISSYDYPKSIGKIKGYYGNVSVLLKAYCYCLLMGGDGLQKTSEIAVLNANYMKEHLIKNKMFDMPYRSLRKHEFVISCESLKKTKNIRALDIAKRLLDYGLHPPTIYFPLIVKEALMIEPTESESKDTLDSYIHTLSQIAQEDPESVRKAPSNTPVQRIDEHGAVKNPILTWKMRPKQ